MTPTKLLLGQIFVVFAIVIAGVWIATQWAAEMLAYQPELGPPWFYLHNLPSTTPGPCSPGGIISTPMRRMSSRKRACWPGPPADLDFW
jgi:hypothetical protein